MAINISKLLQEVADAVESLNEKADEAASAKVVFDAAQTAQREAQARVEAVRAQVNDILGQAPQGRVRN